MTSADTAADRATAQSAPPGAPPRLVLLLATSLLAAGAVAYLAAAAALVWPTLFEGIAFLSYGRLLPVATGLLMAWLLVAAVGAAWFVLPRVGSGAVDTRLMAPAALLTAAAATAGALAPAAGLGEGGRYLEGPWFTEAALAVGLMTAAAAATRAVRAVEGGPAIPAWYLLGALWWGAAAAAVAAVPGLDGIPAALQARFAAAVLTGLVPAAAGLGAVYYLVGRALPGTGFHPRLGPIGFWSLGFAWLWLGPASLQYGPTPDWLETIPVLFSFGLVVAVAAILADLAHALRGRWGVLAGNRPLQLALAGVAPFALLAGQTLVQSLRGPSTVVRFTDWEAALQVLTLLGAATLWLAALTAAALPGERRWNRALGAAHLYGSVGGLAVALAGWWVAGLQQGYTWVGSVEAGQATNAGDAFRTSVVPLQAMRVVALAGLALLAAGVLAHLAATVPAAAGRRQPPGEPAGFAPGGTGAPSIVAGALVLFAVAGLSVFALPSIEVGGGPGPEASAVLTRAPEGRDLYVTEGCWQCHTQQVRAIVTDVGLGPVSVPGDYDGGPAGLLGHRRVGPDLTHVASRGWDADGLAAHLADPRAVRPWSIMPSYAHLDPDDLDALAAYLMSLE